MPNPVHESHVASLDGHGSTGVDGTGASVGAAGVTSLGAARAAVAAPSMAGCAAVVSHHFSPSRNMGGSGTTVGHPAPRPSICERRDRTRPGATI